MSDKSRCQISQKLQCSKHYSNIIYIPGKSELMIWKVILNVPLYAQDGTKPWGHRKRHCTYNQGYFTLVENTKLTYFKQLKKHLLLKMNASGYNPIKSISVNMWYSVELKIND